MSRKRLTLRCFNTQHDFVEQIFSLKGHSYGTTKSFSDLNLRDYLLLSLLESVDNMKNCEKYWQLKTLSPVPVPKHLCQYVASKGNYFEGDTIVSKLCDNNFIQFTFTSLYKFHF